MARMTVLGVPRADAVELVQSYRRDGLSVTEIARHIGVKRGTVASWLSDPDLSRQAVRRKGYARPCAWCGKPLSGCNGRARTGILCRSCTMQARSKWTRERIIEVIQEFAQTYGRAPAASEFSPQLFGRRAPDARDRCEMVKAAGDYPSYSWVRYQFGSWNAAIEAAGLTPRKPGQYIGEEAA